MTFLANNTALGLEQEFYLCQNDRLSLPMQLSNNLEPQGTLRDTKLCALKKMSIDNDKILILANITLFHNFAKERIKFIIFGK